MRVRPPRGIRVPLESGILAPVPAEDGQAVAFCRRRPPDRITPAVLTSVDNGGYVDKILLPGETDALRERLLFVRRLVRADPGEAIEGHGDALRLVGLNDQSVVSELDQRPDDWPRKSQGGDEDAPSHVHGCFGLPQHNHGPAEIVHLLDRPEARHRARLRRRPARAFWSRGAFWRRRAVGWARVVWGGHWRNIRYRLDSRAFPDAGRRWRSCRGRRAGCSRRGSGTS